MGVNFWVEGTPKKAIENLSLQKMVNTKRRQNEKQFKNWTVTESGGRVYWFEIRGRLGWSAKYVKEVNALEETISFRQEIYDENGILREIHEKYPVDKGHQKLF